MLIPFRKEISQKQLFYEIFPASLASREKKKVSENLYGDIILFFKKYQ